MHREIRSGLDEAYRRVLEKSCFIQGTELSLFEQEFAAYCGTKYCVGTASGLDAVCLALRALGIGPGDEVLVPANTFIATALAVSRAGAVPVFADPDIGTYNTPCPVLVYHFTRGRLPQGKWFRCMRTITDGERSTGWRDSGMCRRNRL
jgi:dTDP-4-amino-4,6-dideoxygalactose transaminase